MSLGWRLRDPWPRSDDFLVLVAVVQKRCPQSVKSAMPLDLVMWGFRLVSISVWIQSQKLSQYSTTYLDNSFCAPYRKDYIREIVLELFLDVVIFPGDLSGFPYRNFWRLGPLEIEYLLLQRNFYILKIENELFPQ